jgi:outer membrane biosynthesis protein TonB
MRTVLVVMLAALALTGCASRAAKGVPPGVPVDSRPTPPPPPPEPVATPDTAAARPSNAKPPSTSSPAPTPAPEPTPEPPPPPVESVMTPEERRQTLARIVADTTSAGIAVRRCANRKLLPDQESVFDTARSLLGQTRAALERDELWRAESLARKARQLAASLNCPG